MNFQHLGKGEGEYHSNSDMPLPDPLTQIVTAVNRLNFILTKVSVIGLDLFGVLIFPLSNIFLSSTLLTFLTSVIFM